MSDLDTTIDELHDRPAGDAGTEHHTEAQDPSGTRDAADTGETPGPIPYQRFKEVNEQASRYRKLGKAEEIEAKLHRLDQYERERQAADAEAREQQEAEARKANPKLADAEDLVTDIVRRKFPGVETMAQKQAEQERLVIERHIEDGFRAIPEQLKAHGIPVTPEAVQSFETLIESQILRDPQLKQDFWSPAKQSAAVTEAFKRVRTTVIDPALMATGAKRLSDAAERRSRTLDRATASGTAKVKPLEFQSKHAPGSVAYDRDRAAHRDKLIDAHLDAVGFDGEEASL